MSSCRVSGRRAAPFWGQERGGDPRLFHLVCGADQRPLLQVGAGERHADMRHQLGSHWLLPVAVCQTTPQRDGPHSHSPHTLCLLLTNCLAPLYTSAGLALTLWKQRIRCQRCSMNSGRPVSMENVVNPECWQLPRVCNNNGNQSLAGEDV